MYAICDGEILVLAAKHDEHSAKGEGRVKAGSPRSGWRRKMLIECWVMAVLIAFYYMREAAK